MIDSGAGAGHFLPALSATGHPVPLPSSSSQPRAVNQLNGKLCTRCHQANPLFRQYNYADGHVHVPEDNVGKYSYAGEICAFIFVPFFFVFSSFLYFFLTKSLKELRNNVDGAFTALVAWWVRVGYAFG